MFPWFKFISMIAATLGLGGLALYGTLTEEQKEEVDGEAHDLAIQGLTRWTRGSSPNQLEE